MDKEFIIAIELGSSKMTGIAGKKKDAATDALIYRLEPCASLRSIWGTRGSTAKRTTAMRCPSR